MSVAKVQPRPPRKRFSFRRAFATGLVIVLPVLVTFWVLRFGLRQLNGTVTPLLLQAIDVMGGSQWLKDPWIQVIVPPLISMTLLLLGIYLVGLFGGNVIGRQILALVDRLVKGIPIVRGIYGSTRQFMETFSGDGRAFSKVVLVEYPRRDLWSLALLTADTTGEIPKNVGGDLVSVFIPTTPNPTSGWLLFVPAGDVTELNMTVDEAFRMIISGGVLTPAYRPAPIEITEAPTLASDGYASES